MEHGVEPDFFGDGCDGTDGGWGKCGGEEWIKMASL